MTLVDTHCHLNDLQAFPVTEAAVEEAAQAGVRRMVVVGVDSESSERAVELAERFDAVYAAVGWHPNHAAEYEPGDLRTVRRLLAHEKTVAMGEIGLDYYRDHASKEQQAACLLAQLDLAQELGVPVVFHCRNAYPDLLDTLEGRPPHKWLFHCFAGDPEDAARATGLGAWFGVDGPVTYKGSDGLREILRGLDRTKVVLETDSPWMAPVPYRGQRNRPAWLTRVNEAVASLWGVSDREAAARTTANAQDFFGELGL